jgi:hypothetical protein
MILSLMEDPASKFTGRRWGGALKGGVRSVARIPHSIDPINLLPTSVGCFATH